MLTVLRRQNFALLWAAGAISVLGDWVLFSALPFYVYTLTGSALATGTMFMAQAVPRVLLGSVAGVFVDRWDRQRTLVIADLARAALVLLLLLVRTPDEVWLVYLVGAAQSSIGQFFRPARGALVPHLVPREQLLAANALNGVADNVTRLIGPLAGGALAGAFGVGSVVVADSASFFASGLLLWRLAVPAGGRPPPTVVPTAAGLSAAWTGAWRDWRAGLLLVRGDRFLRTLLLAIGTFTVGQGVLDVVFVPFVKDLWRGDARTFGLVVSAQGLGGLAGGLVIGATARRVPPAWVLVASLAALGGLGLVMFNTVTLTLGLPLMTLFGLAATGLFVSLGTLLQARVDDRFRGRVLGTFATTQALLVLVGMAVASALGTRLGVGVLVNAAAGIFVIAALAAVPLILKPDLQQAA